MTANDPVWDAVIIGAGSAGSVVAHRLAHAGWRVALVEAGPGHGSPLVSLPRAWPLLGRVPSRIWEHPVADRPGETWRRGRGVGGSSNVNGMIWCRGFPEDYDSWSHFGARGWGWARIARAFAQIENIQDDPDPMRGHDGPVTLSRRLPPAPWAEAIRGAARDLGWPVLDGVNGAAREGIGLYDHSISARGVRSDARRAFLSPPPPGLRIIPHAVVERILTADGKATGIRYRARGGESVELSAREVILCAGSLGSPQVLHASGIGDAGALRQAGIAPVVDLPGVGQGLAEHLVIALPHRARVLGLNHELRSWRIVANLLRHAIGRQTVLSYGASEMGGFFRTSPDIALPDMQLSLSPYTFDRSVFARPRTEAEPGVTLIGYFLQPESRGHIAVGGAINAGWLATEGDRRAAVGMMRELRRFAAAPSLAALIECELFPGAAVQSEDDMLAAFRERVVSGLHATGSCSMGEGRMAVVDGNLRLHGLGGLRVVDASVIPAPIRGNTNGAVMALAWAAADTILAERGR